MLCMWETPQFLQNNAFLLTSQLSPAANHIFLFTNMKTRVCRKSWIAKRGCLLPKHAFICSSCFVGQGHVLILTSSFRAQLPPCVEPWTSNYLKGMIHNQLLYFSSEYSMFSAQCDHSPKKALRGLKTAKLLQEMGAERITSSGRTMRSSSRALKCFLAKKIGPL